MSGTRLVGRGRTAVVLVIAILVTTVSAAATVIPASPAAAGPTPSYWRPKGCGQVYFLGARGSGQSPTGSAADGGSGFGPEVYRIWTTFVAGLNHNVQPDSIGPVYPSSSVDLLKPTKAELAELAAAPLIPPPTWILRVHKFLSGIDAGANAVYKALVARANPASATYCPHERIVLAGYSQGAMVVHRVLTTLAKHKLNGILNRIDGVALIADGDRGENAAGCCRGLPEAAGKKGVGIASALQLANEGDVPKESQSVTVNVCTKNDLVCDFHLPYSLVNYSSATQIHTSYVGRTALLDAAAKRFRNQLRASVPGAPTEAIGVPGAASIALSWHAPKSNGGTAVTSYSIRYSSDGLRTWQIAPPSTASSATVNGLTAGVAVVFEVAATNDVGSGPWSMASQPVTPTSPQSSIAIVQGGFHTCVLTAVGGVECWGDGYLGNGTISDSLTPVDVTGLSSGVIAIAASWYDTCALTSAGDVECWGQGNVGDGTSAASLTPVDVTGLSSGVVAITAGIFYACALTVAGAVKCWGDNEDGQLGDGTTTARLTPVDVTGLSSGVSVIAAGAYHTCAVTDLGGVVCWGDNKVGELGDGTRDGGTGYCTPGTGVVVCSPTPVDVIGLSSGVVAIAAGASHTCALTIAGGAKCWGDNEDGQLGDGTNTGPQSCPQTSGSSACSADPVDVIGLSSGVAAIAAGASHTCALTIAGGAKCWGDNDFGELGDGTTSQQLTPAAVIGLSSGVNAIAAGFGITYAFTSAGGVKCWGDNAEGQLGDGSTTERLTPVNVLGL